MLGHKYYCPACGGILDIIQEESDDVTPDVSYFFECRNCSKRSRAVKASELTALKAFDDPEKAKKEALAEMMGL